ncbi:MAG: ATP-dependent helicase [Chitinophagaceae bacterium]|nr:ATP-dependent helicase [Chitinophagaceae bacterium]MCA6452372.1 ATP-dependent helicase [Chitinophagaceae bacterium]MCA6456660.1 ATP-dependent helicase [Chitinophagaceae bacterium]MCA6458778.1 ATP-dependent helicase [Chitinophagaceae bacterium]MCA6464286.1 ATP-dependent helicase [Chitinophagaceae bacterium]
MSATQQQREQFEKIYANLNEQQRIAVDTIEGPVMVIAGPGTGKTQILGARIGKILLDTDTQAENILCLTYTDAGAVAMRKRLLGFIGPDAYKVNIYTFHAFCNDIIQENLSLFEKTVLDPISDLEKIDLFKQLIDGFPKNHPLKRYRGDVYFEINNLQQLFSTMKREGWTPAYINQKIDEYLASIPTRDEFVYQRAYKQFKAGDLKENKIEEVKEKMEKLRAAVNEFDRFQKLMRSRNRYDFDDMINWVIRAFEENKTLLARYQEQFLYILVDEYQDTSGTQNRLVELLISYWEQPNVFVVGDDDQSIYRFQGANVENMEAFAQRYEEDLLAVVLKDNYRSTQPILDISKTLIDRNEERLVKKINGLTKNLTAANQLINQLSHKPVITEYETQRQEMIHITLAVEKLLAQGVEPGLISIIYKENKYGEDLSQYFAQRNIPVYSKRHLNILEIPLAKKIILLLEYLAAEHDVPDGGDEMLFEILHFDWFRIAPVEIAKLTTAVADRKFGQNKTSLRKLLHEKVNTPPRELFSQAAPTGMKLASDAIEKLLADVSNTTLVNLVENCIRDAGVLNSIMLSPDKHWHLQVLTGLFDFIKEEARRNPNLTLDQLVNIFMLMEKEGLSLPLVQISGSEKGVNLLTAHGSKGLEFEHVFLAGCNAASWEKKRKPGGGYSFPDTMFSSQPKQKEEEELRRLFYVALTRARLHLHISYSRFRNDGKDLEPSMFIAEIQDTHALPVEKILLDKDVLSEFAMVQFAAAQAPEIDRSEAEFVTQLLDKFVMNVTALNNYLKCPLQFYFQNLVRVPSGKSEATEFGSAVHHALHKLFEKMQQTEQFPGKEEFILDFEWYMNRNRESFTKEQFARRIEYGQEVLGNYYNQYISSWNKVVVVERTIRNIVVQGVPLKGKLDKLEFNGKDVNVVDYKTGDIDKAKDKLKPPHDRDPNGGDYWRQAVFYKILVDHYEQKNWTAVSTEFDFIEPDKKKQYRKEKILIRPEDITTVTEQIKTVWQKIQDRDFYTGCGKPECHWCNFVKTNEMAVALHELSEEADTE